MLFPTELFYEMLSHNYQINNLRMVNKATYNACSNDDFWLNIHNYYGNSTTTPTLEKDVLPIIKKVYAFLNQVHNHFTLISTKIFSHDILLLNKHLSMPYFYMEKHELLLIFIKNDTYTVKILDNNIDINKHQLFQLLFDFYERKKVVAFLTYKKI